MGSTRSRKGKRGHRSLGVNTRTGEEHMACGLSIVKEDIVKDWRKPDCKSCAKNT
jgi:hypothetical protein